jgi:2-oxoisovalerate dehydrogenase E1 component
MYSDANKVLSDYRIACQSRSISLLARKEVTMGKAKFGIFGDGKEVAQLAMAHAFRKGDFRSGYYRDQTFMIAIGELTVQQYFAQLYAHTSIEAEPASAGRMMNCHFGTRMLDANGDWRQLINLCNVASDISSNASQMPRLLGLAYASKLYRKNKDLHRFTDFSNYGNEVAFGTIGNAATSEGIFWETMNAAGVLQVPMLVSVWDDDYGISVPKEYHTIKQSISEALKGFARTKDMQGIEIFAVKGWDYSALCRTYSIAADLCRTEHVPVLVHVQEMTQPQGHSTSGSHERYKSTQRLQWEAEYDCIAQMRSWIIRENIATDSQLCDIEKQEEEYVKMQRNSAWENFISDLKPEYNEAIKLLNNVAEYTDNSEIADILSELHLVTIPLRMHTYKALRKSIHVLRETPYMHKKPIIDWLHKQDRLNHDRFSSHLYSESANSALNIPEEKPNVSNSSYWVDAREILQACFDNIFNTYPKVFAIGEDIGIIGDVNQAFAGLQKKYGEIRITDTSIRESTIVGQGIGAAMRGLRPIVEIQYLDYLPYALQILMDDLATLHYRTKGGQKAPVIIRTRGHRLEGIWHSGSYMAGIINNIRGIYVIVPRNMTQAAGFYNTMLRSDDAALIIERLNAYRLKEQMPINIGTFTVPIGVPEILLEGDDITVVTYGAMCSIVLEAAKELQKLEIGCEVIDVQTLLPFDVKHVIVESLKKTNRIVFADEDVPGGTTAYMMQKVLEEQKGYRYLDSDPVTITSKDHRPAYADDGNYFSKPNVEDIVEAVYRVFSDAMPARYPDIDDGIKSC